MKLRMVFILALGLPSLHAGTLEVDLSNSSQTGAPGDILAFVGTITNVSTTDTIFLNSASSTSASSNLTIGLLPFFLNAPLFLEPLEVSGPFEIFDVTIDSATPDGLIAGSSVSIQGGLDSNTFDDLADPSFDVTVQSAVTATPEPSAGWLVIAGAAVFAILTRNHNGLVRS